MSAVVKTELLFLTVTIHHFDCPKSAKQNKREQNILVTLAHHLICFIWLLLYSINCKLSTHAKKKFKKPTKKSFTKHKKWKILLSKKNKENALKNLIFIVEVCIT